MKKVIIGLLLFTAMLGFGQVNSGSSNPEISVLKTLNKESTQQGVLLESSSIRIITNNIYNELLINHSKITLVGFPTNVINNNIFNDATVALLDWTNTETVINNQPAHSFTTAITTPLAGFQSVIFEGSNEITGNNVLPIYVKDLSNQKTLSGTIQLTSGTRYFTGLSIGWRGSYFVGFGLACWFYIVIYQSIIATTA